MVHELNYFLREGGKKERKKFDLLVIRGILLGFTQDAHAPQSWRTYGLKCCIDRLNIKNNSTGETVEKVPKSRFDVS